eukprot:gene12507-66993_t
MSPLCATDTAHQQRRIGCRPYSNKMMLRFAFPKVFGFDFA